MLINNQSGSYMSLIHEVTCHICNSDKLLFDILYLKQPLKVILVNGHICVGIVKLQAKQANEKKCRCKLHDILYLPQLFYNLFSVSQTTEID